MDIKEVKLMTYHANLYQTVIRFFKLAKEAADSGISRETRRSTADYDVVTNNYSHGVIFLDGWEVDSPEALPKVLNKLALELINSGDKYAAGNIKLRQWDAALHEACDEIEARIDALQGLQTFLLQQAGVPKPF